MSVFGDFQRLWVQRFPQSSLSDAWEQDVRASLQRHKQKIQELTKELEQETLYVEYLERLLSDVEKLREAGGDPTTLFEAATTSSTQQQSGITSGFGAGNANNSSVIPPACLQEGVTEDNKQTEESGLLRLSGEGNTTNKTDRDSNKYSSYTTNGSNGGGGCSNTSESNDEHEDKDAGTEKDFKNIQIQKNGALQQCINELTLHRRKDIEDTAKKNIINNSNSSNTNSSSCSSSSNNNNNNNNNINCGIVDNQDNKTTITSSTIDQKQQQQPSHFVTVIEVKETKVTPVKHAQSTSSTTTTTGIGDNGENSRIEGLTSSTVTAAGGEENINNDKDDEREQRERERHSSESEVITLSSFERKTSNNVEPSAPPMSPAMSTSSPSSTISSAMAAFQQQQNTTTTTSNLDAKKKVPPRPPPKYVRRVEPPTVPNAAATVSAITSTTSTTSSSPSSTITSITKRDGTGISTASTDSLSSNSLERNIKPSDILRQKSSDSLDAKSLAANRKTTPEMNKILKNNADLTEEFGRKIGKSESLEKTKRTAESAMKATGVTGINQSPTGSLGKTTTTTTVTTNSNLGISPTGSLNKFNNARHGTDSPTGSLGKKDGKINDTSLQSVGSKESLASQGNISEIIKSYESISSLSSDSTKAIQTLENEPYYDTVPMDNGDGEYVYIKPGGTGSTSSRDDLSTAGSTLPMPAHPRSHMSSQTSVLEPESPGRSSNYVNIDYFLQQSNETRSSSIDSDGECDAPALMRAISHDEQASQQTPGTLRKISGNLRGTKIRSILSSIIQSETIYVECLNKMMQYKKAIHATLGTSQPVIKEDEENTIFFKIDELHAAHTEFINDLKGKLQQNETGDIFVGDAFKRLADIVDLYSSFLHNYGQAIDTVKKCSSNNPQFKKIVSTIILNLQNEQSLTLEDLLHKPVARVQINALVFNDLLNETPPTHPDHQTLRQAQKTIHVFLKQFNVVSQRLPSESNKNLRRMVKNSFIVELVDGHRKLRHLFLFNDVIACAKYKPGRDRFDLELKWFIPLKDVLVFEEDTTTELKESSPANILQLKSQACTVRDQILMEEKDDKKPKSNGLRIGDKHRRKLAELEAQLVLASPNLVFRIGNKSANKTITFFLSSDFERTQWIESIISLQQSCNIPGAHTINALEIQAFVFAMQSRIKTEMGSYLMRNRHDESLLVGDLHFTVQGLTGLEHPADMYICIEVDSYGHYFRKAKTKMVCRSTSPLWNESFVLELEGSENIRILLYEAHQDRPVLKAKHILKLSRTWLQEAPLNKAIKMTDIITLNTSLRFVPGEVTLRRVPTSKPGALFGAKMNQVLKREKRDIPFIISACIREVERRGMGEVGIYRVSGSASDLAKLKKSFETNAYEAEQLLKEVDIHSVTGILKSYLRELPEALFTDALYPKFFETFNQFSNINETARIKALMIIFEELPQSNKSSILHILDHLIRVHQQESENKMSLHNLAMVFGPTLLRPGQTNTKQKDLLASSTVDVMAQAGILYCFLQARIKKD